MMMFSCILFDWLEWPEQFKDFSLQDHWRDAQVALICARTISLSLSLSIALLDHRLECRLV